MITENQQQYIDFLLDDRVWVKVLLEGVNELMDLHITYSQVCSYLISEYLDSHKYDINFYYRLKEKFEGDEYSEINFSDDEDISYFRKFTILVLEDLFTSCLEEDENIKNNLN